MSHHDPLNYQPPPKKPRHRPFWKDILIASIAVVILIVAALAYLFVELSQRAASMP